MTRPYHFWTPEQDERLTAAFLAGESFTAIAAGMGLTVSAAKARAYHKLRLRRDDAWTPRGGRVSVTKTRLRCLGPGAADAPHFFWSPDPRTCRVCPTCKKSALWGADPRSSRNRNA